MKKLFAILLAACFLLPVLSACGGEPEKTAETVEPTETEEETTEEVPGVASPMAESPVYVLQKGASSDEMRALAVRAQHDELTITWRTTKEITYGKSGAGAGKEFRYTPYEVYAGLPYTNGTVGLFHWLAYYDFETGKMINLPSGDALNSSVGNSCAASVLWGWLTCVNSVTWYTTSGINVSHNAIRVGPYTYPDDITDYTKYPTATICQDNGQQTMFESYAQMLPGDVLVTCGNVASGHARMVISEPVIMMNGNAIDGSKSYVYIQEQTTGIFKQTSDFIVTEDGEKRHYNGSPNVKVTFNQLYNSYYLPHTCAEFLGQKDYELPSASLSSPVKDLESLQTSSIQSTYNVCVVTATVTDQSGKSVLSRRAMTNVSDFSKGTMRDFPLARLSVSPTALGRTLTKGTPYTLSLIMIDATGTTYQLASFGFQL